MGAKRKFKRDYIILEAKDANFRYKERVLPKAFAKVEVNDEKSVVALYVENLKYMKDGYRVVAIQSDYETIDLGKINLSEQGKGEFVLNLENDDAEIKGIALLYEKTVPLIGFKGSKIDNYEEILFMGEDDEYIDTDEEEYEEIEYIEIEDDEDYDDEYEEYEEIENISDLENIDHDDYIEEYDEDEHEAPQYNRVTKQTLNKKNTYEPIDHIKETKNNKFKNITNDQIKREDSKHSQNKLRQEIIKQSVSNQPRQTENYKAPGTLLMPRQIKKGLKHFKEVKPFVADYIDDTRWWKIEINPTTLCGYTMPYLGYVNTLNYTMYSDAVMHSYKYRHYLFGVQYDEYNKRRNYVYAVPGNKNEQPDKGHTGFTIYQPCDNRNDSLGYWLCFIDSRSRKIIK